MTHPPPGHVQQLPTQMAHLDAISHVVECFLLQQDNVIHQALLDSWGASTNPCTIYMLLMVPLDTLTITYGRTSDARPLSNAYKNWITQFQDMYDCCNSQTTWSDHSIFDLTSSHFGSYCMSLTYHHGWSPPVLPLGHRTHAPACHHLPLVSPECSSQW
jgi:hypothetical protein